MTISMDKSLPKPPRSLSPWSKAEASKFYHGELTNRIIASAIAVHKELGPGFLEKLYEEAFAIELAHNQIPHERQHSIQVRHQSLTIGMHRVDLIVDRKVVVELKAVKEIEDAHLAICLSYLKATNLRVGLIINFSESKTRIRRVMRGFEQTTEKGNEGVFGVF